MKLKRSRFRSLLSKMKKILSQRPTKKLKRIKISAAQNYFCSISPNSRNKEKHLGMMSRPGWMFNRSRINPRKKTNTCTQMAKRIQIFKRSGSHRSVCRHCTPTSRIPRGETHLDSLALESSSSRSNHRARTLCCKCRTSSRAK